MSTAPSSISDLIAELIVTADRIDRMTDAPAPRIGIGADTLWEWERLLRSAAVALTEALHLADALEQYIAEQK